MTAARIAGRVPSVLVLIGFVEEMIVLIMARIMELVSQRLVMYKLLQVLIRSRAKILCFLPDCQSPQEIP